MTSTSALKILKPHHLMGLPPLHLPKNGLTASKLPERLPSPKACQIPTLVTMPSKIFNQAHIHPRVGLI